VVFTGAIIIKPPVLQQPQVITMTKQRPLLQHTASLWGWACPHMLPPNTITITPFIKQDHHKIHHTTRPWLRLPVSCIPQRLIQSASNPTQVSQTTVQPQNQTVRRPVQHRMSRATRMVMLQSLQRLQKMFGKALRAEVAQITLVGTVLWVLS
jgi:hypothetical protein